MDNFLDEIDSVLGLNYDNIPEQAVDVETYARHIGKSNGWAHEKLRGAWRDGVLDRAKGRGGKYFYWPKTV